MDKKIVQQIMRYCAYQERCHSEVRYKLVELGARGLELENIITLLITEKYLDEERFAKIYAGSKFRILQWGKVKITQNLKQKQVSAYCIKKGLAEIPDDDYQKTITQLAHKKWASLKNKKGLLTKQKVVAYILSKGYSSSEAFKVVADLMK